MKNLFASSVENLVYSTGDRPSTLKLEEERINQLKRKAARGNYAKELLLHGSCTCGGEGFFSGEGECLCHMKARWAYEDAQEANEELKKLGF